VFGLDIACAESHQGREASHTVEDRHLAWPGSSVGRHPLDADPTRYLEQRHEPQSA
jgi:hypothetical protein